MACETGGSRAPLILPNDAVHLESVLTEVQQGQFRGTVEYYLNRRLDKHGSESFLIYEALSQGYTKTFQLSKALGCLNKMLEQQPDNVYALVRRGWVLERLHQFEEAEEDYRRAIALQPDHALAQQRLAENFALRSGDSRHLLAIPQCSPAPARARPSSPRGTLVLLHP
jgi:tetratricopeptide (TPR) repeat protein